MLEVLGKPNAPLPVMMPARLAATPGGPAHPAADRLGPFRFLKDQWRPGSAMVLERNPDYRAARGAARFPGGRQEREDRPARLCALMPDQSTGANALIAGEID